MLHQLGANLKLKKETRFDLLSDRTILLLKRKQYVNKVIKDIICITLQYCASVKIIIIVLVKVCMISGTCTSA